MTEKNIVPARENRVNHKRRKKKIPFFLVLLSIPYVIVLSLITAGNVLGPERWWWSSFNLFLPQWIWGLPGAALLLIAFFKCRTWVWLPLICIGWVGGPVMGLRLHKSGNACGKHLRVMTYNLKMGARDQDAIAEEIKADKPDIMIFQEMSHQLKNTLDPLLAGWNVSRIDQFEVASRYPISDVSLCNRIPRKVPYHAMRCEITIGEKVVTVYCIHLLSPRNGLSSIRHKLDDGISEWEHNVAERLMESQQLTEQIGTEEGPVIAAGDFNSPVQGLTCRSLIDLNMKDAFDVSGNGYGYTYGRFLKPQHSFIRIDHILFNKYLQADKCWAGNEEGADHCPVIADLYLQN